MPNRRSSRRGQGQGSRSRRRSHNSPNNTHENTHEKDTYFHAAKFFRDALKIGRRDKIGNIQLDTIVDDYNYLIKSFGGDEAISILFGQIFGEKMNSSGTRGPIKVNHRLFIELSDKHTYNFGRYIGALPGDPTTMCEYPLKCKSHILKFIKDEKLVYFPPIVDRPENNNSVPEQDYVNVYTMNGKDYVHRSMGLVIDSKHKGGRRTRKRPCQP